MGGLLTPITGSVMVGSLAARDALRQCAIGVVFQQPTLLPWRNASANASLLAEVGRRQGKNAKRRAREEAQRVIDAKTPAGVRRVDIHDDLQEELAAHKAARGDTWQPGKPAFLNARGKRWTRNAIAQHVILPALEEANRQRAQAGLPAIREQITPHTMRYTCIASLFAAGADQ